MQQKQAGIAAALAIGLASLTGCDRGESALPPAPDSAATQPEKVGVIDINVRSVEQEAAGIRAGISESNTLKLSPGMSLVLANCFDIPSSEPLASHWRAGGSTEPDHRVLLMQSLLLKLGYFEDNNPNQLDGIYGDGTKKAIEKLQATFGESTDARGHAGVESSCRSIAQALSLIDAGEGPDGAPALEFERPSFGRTLFGGAGSPGLIQSAYLIIDRAQYPEVYPNNNSADSPIASSLQAALFDLGYFEEATGRSAAVDGNWGPMSEAANEKFETRMQRVGDPAPDGTVGATTARRLWLESLRHSLAQ